MRDYWSSFSLGVGSASWIRVTVHTAASGDAGKIHRLVVEPVRMDSFLRTVCLLQDIV